MKHCRCLTKHLNAQYFSIGNRQHCLTKDIVMSQIEFKFCFITMSDAKLRRNSRKKR